MNAKEFTKEHYNVICTWWKEHNWPQLRYELLPTGFIVEGYAAGFLYDTDTSLAWIEWIISNPKSEPELRDKALDLVIESLLSHAKKIGKTFIFTSSISPRLIARYNKHGFAIADQNVTHLGKNI